eukprot:c26218_g1_i2 orf=867-3287(+)
MNSFSYRMMAGIHRIPVGDLFFWMKSCTSWKRLKNPDGLRNLKFFFLGLSMVKTYYCGPVYDRLLSNPKSAHVQSRLWQVYPALVTLYNMRCLQLRTGDFLRAEANTESNHCWQTSLAYYILGAELWKDKLSAISFLRRRISSGPSLKIACSSDVSRWHGFEDNFKISTQLLMGKKGLGMGHCLGKVWNFRTLYTLTTGLCTKRTCFEGLGDGKVNLVESKATREEIVSHDSEWQVSDTCYGMETDVYPNSRREPSGRRQAQGQGKSHKGEHEEIIQSSVEEANEQETDGVDEWATELKESMVELAATLKDLESRVHPNDEKIGIVCLRLAQVCDSVEEDPEIILRYGERALKILGTIEESVETAMCLQVMGSSSYKLKMYDKSLAELEHAAAILEKLKIKIGGRKLRDIEYSVHVSLGHVKTELGMNEEALQNYFESLSVNERFLEPGHPELGMSYQQVAEVCMNVGRYNEAVPLCVKALGIFENFFGKTSSQATVVRRLLALIYTDLQQYEKVLEEHKKIRPVLEAHGLSKEVAFLDLSTAEALLELGRHEDVISALGLAIEALESNNPIYGLAMVYLGKAYSGMKRYKEAKHYCNKALNCFSKNTSVEVAKGLVELASLYQELNDVDEATIMYRKALSVFECSPDSEEAVADVQSQLGMLLLFKGQTDEAMMFMDKAVAAFKDIHGPEHQKLLFLYNHMGIAYMECEKIDDAVDTFERARQLSLSLFGPEDPYTIGVYQNLVNSYTVLGRYDMAIKYQKCIVGAVRKLGEGAFHSLEDVEKRLQTLIETAGKYPVQQKTGASR